MATPTRNGRLPGYAQINQPSLTCYLGLLLAARCGIEHPDLAEAIAKTRTFVASYAGRGALPYGVHPPYTHVFNNNGSSATAALAMAFLGEREAAAFFAGQCAASYDTMEFGHASHYFNTLWTPMGVNVAGPAVTRAFFKRARWVYTLYRGWDGRFTYDGTSMKQCNDNGALLLNYCIPRRAVHLTGKAADRSLWLDADDADRAVAAGRIDYDALSDDELIALFGHPAPQVTRRAAWTLRDREGGFIPKLVGLLDHGTQTERISAIGFFGYECPEPWAAAQVERLGAILRDHNEAPKVRAAAADALSWRGDAAYPYYAAMLRLVVDDEPGDPLRLIDVSAGKSLVNLCDNPFEAGLVTDKDLFYAAALKLAGHKRQSARGYGMRMLRGMPAEDFGRVGDEVRHVVLNRDPTYHSYHNPGSAVQPGVFLLAELNIREGLPWTMQVLEDPSGKYGFKVRAVLQSLSAYGVHARPLFEQIRSDPKKQNWSRGKFSPSWRQLVEAVESGRKQSEELIPFEQAMRAGSR